ncbi:leukocyte immunoglobulin-like receptor subfamily B member 3 isoform X2 [Seriola dumerili]|uniref:leukocyte immunoglobulin-like receptor subfamily B member 3 isoform X2 n=1 Tax=Seriola dumerili TaxID=41447 RepID=UPI000BBED3C5|nr:leukocyte immunoglobulin-like receptor subfamily B member 3 isoform X2 [Seriola dumerili]
MQVVSGGRSLWIYTLIFTSLQLWGRLSASTSSPTLPAPTLNIYLRSNDSVTLICKVPEGHHGFLFMLYKIRENVDSQELQSGTDEVKFTFRVPEGDSGELFCCLYRDQGGRYSAFSPYLRLEQQRETAPTRSIPSFPSPVLSMVPSTGVVKRGDMLTFSCSVPDLSSQTQSQSGYNNKPDTFLLLKYAEHTGTTSIIAQPQASQVSSPEPQPGVFTVGPVRGEEEGEYTCIYQITKKRRLVNSTVSNMIQVTVTGSPAYPGAVFYLYLADNEHPIATHQAKVIHHQATFPVPVQETLLVFYKCQYSVLLGKKSELSHSLAVSRGISPPSSLDSSGVDWPLVLGSFSAVVLFLLSVLLVVLVALRKAKAAAEKEKKRQDGQFWAVNAKDHIVDPPLRCSSFTSEEWANGDTETASRSPLWNSLSTFTSPIH